ncbi:MAG: Holliday junction branch migration protein RuvA [Candidatus Riflebacteria bacterium]|nr:Holliday junction branch migration protein RuvA [Candidatus Riflebacteria bacterium]
MIALLKGTLVEKGPGHVLVDTGGVGYEVSVPTSLSERLPEAGAQICLRTHMEASEGLPELFGFADRDELEVFRALIRVSRVGPRLALKVLSGLTPAEVVGAVTRRDAAAFRSVPGVGDETAQRLLVEMARLVKKLVLTVRPENATRAEPGRRADARAPGEAGARLLPGRDPMKDFDWKLRHLAAFSCVAGEIVRIGDRPRREVAHLLSQKSFEQGQELLLELLDNLLSSAWSKKVDINDSSSCRAFPFADSEGGEHDRELLEELLTAPALKDFEARSLVLSQRYAALPRSR